MSEPAPTPAAHPDAGDRVTALATLLQLCDSALPAGGFAHSDGIEQLVADGLVRDAASLTALLRAQRRLTLVPADARFLALAHAAALPARRDAASLRGEALRAVAEAELAFRPAARQREASMLLGAGLLRAARAFATDTEAPAVAAVVSALAARPARASAFGAIAAVLGIPQPDACEGYVAQAVMAMAQAAVRLARVSALEAVGCVRQALLDPPRLDGAAEPAAFSPLLDIAAMRHELLEPRLFAS